MTNGQMAAIVDKYVADHPERWHENIPEIIASAIGKACEAREK
jgi:hypothetical protein